MELRSGVLLERPSPKRREGKDEWVEKKKKKKNKTCAPYATRRSFIMRKIVVTDQIVEKPPIKQLRYRDPNNLVWFSNFFFFFFFLLSAKVKSR